MSATGYTRTAEYARGFTAARDMRAWLGQGGGWVVLDTDQIGEHARPATAVEEAGVVAFYQGYAPGLHVTHHYAACVKCEGTGVHIEPGEFGDEAAYTPCGVCGGCGYSVEVEDGIAF